MEGAVFRAGWETSPRCPTSCWDSCPMRGYTPPGGTGKDCGKWGRHLICCPVKRLSDEGGGRTNSWDLQKNGSGRMQLAQKGMQIYKVNFKQVAFWTVLAFKLYE